MIDQKGSAHLIVIVILLLGLALAVYLTQSKQLFKSRASSDLIGFHSPSGAVLQIDSANKLPVTQSLSVQVQLNPPAGN